MAVALDFFNTPGSGAHAAVALRPAREAEASAPRISIRRVVNRALLESLDVTNEHCLTVLEAGQGDIPPSSADVIIADLELIHSGTPEDVADELMAACRPGGRLGLACPLPGSFLAELNARIAAYTGTRDPATDAGLPGTREQLDALFGSRAMALGARERSLTLRFASAEHWLAEWRKSYAPLRRAYRRIDPEWRDQFTTVLLQLASRFAEPHAGALSISCEYLEFIVHKAGIQ